MIAVVEAVAAEKVAAESATETGTTTVVAVAAAETVIAAEAAGARAEEKAEIAVVVAVEVDGIAIASMIAVNARRKNRCRKGFPSRSNRIPTRQPRWPSTSRVPGEPTPWPIWPAWS